ncbi:uncharacterized protein DUF2384 [Marinobacter sp. LV10MA510-1]|nr:uncharacterized protein DUF2384 [Marinobacter sp. LV10MA510-1]
MRSHQKYDAETLHRLMLPVAKELCFSSSELFSICGSQTEIENNRPAFETRKCSLLLGIAKALNILYTDPQHSAERLRRPSSDEPFNGDSPMDLMQRSEKDLQLVRRYFDYRAQPH